MYSGDKNQTINLSGASVSLSRSTVISTALEQRSEHLWTWAALKLQHFFRRRQARLRPRKELELELELEIEIKIAPSIQGLRALVILGKADDDV
ncbi:hypothetical protein H0H92_001981, partial [Tricholoma furcatifolium]